MAAVYRPAVDALGHLEELRSEIDAHEGPRDLSNVDAANGFASRYGEPITALLDAHVVTAVAIDEPGLGRTVELIGLCLRQIEITRLLTTSLLMIATSEGDPHQPDELAELVSLHGQLDSGRDDVARLAADGEHADAARDLDDALEAAGLPEVIMEVIETGQVDLASLTVASPEASDAWHRFLDRLLDALPAGP